ncbi:LysE family translocator [Dechloromonas sp. ZY10]|uniref:LysE family translocator n=1 Tax=Dechloromonas aquae TaxID=2664436 RepID=UPI0035295567
MDSLLTSAQLLPFLAASMLLTLAPGPDNLLVLSLGIARGRRHGMAFGLGCAAGCINHTLLAALGVGALIVASEAAFTALRVAGGLYLLWLGLKAIRHAAPARPGEPAAGRGESCARLFRRGLLASAINPKVVLFFLAFLPQFVAPGRGNAGWQIAQLGVVFMLQAALVLALIGAFAGVLGERLARRPGVSLWLERIAGGVFVLLGARLLTGR